MGLFSVLRDRRDATFLLGGLLTGGAGVALITTAVKHFLKNSRERRIPAERETRLVLPDDIEAALGEERVQWLMRQTGLTRYELLAGLRFSTEGKPKLIADE